MPDALPTPIDPLLATEALAGLSRPQKRLSAKFFYDAEGCRLFQTITALPEYYLTRTEHALLEALSPAVAAMIGRGAVLVEYGASDEAKAELLLRERVGDGTARPVFDAYVPIDVAAGALEQVRRRLQRAHPALTVVPVPADFQQPLTLSPILAAMPRLGFFPGSTIGNFAPNDARRFLGRVRETLGRDALLLVGVDLRKDPARLFAAYNDAAGVTALFNLNMLRRLNREAGADFALSQWRHRAIYNEEKGRIEMHLVSVREQRVRLGGQTVRFAADETIHTENSYKYTVKSFSTLARLAGWRSRRIWTDTETLFAVYLLAAT